MQKKWLLVIILLLFTGCTKINGEDTKHASYVVNCLGNKSYVNNVAVGYKYYLPRGVKKVKDFDYNQKFEFNGNYLYLFVDLNSYYYKTSSDVREDLGDYYFQKISYDGKNGYVRIIKDNDYYYTKVFYNYAKVEFYSQEKDINELLIMSATILNSIRYKRNIIEVILNESVGASKEFSYEIEKPVDASNNFSQYLEEYVTEENEKEKLPDE